MMRCLIGVLFILIPSIEYSQEQPRLLLGSSYNFSLVNPNTRTLFRPHPKENIHSRDYSVFAAVRVYNKSNLFWYAGLSYKNVRYIFEDRVKTLDYQYGDNNQTYAVTHVYVDPADLITRSNSLGINNEVVSRFWNLNKWSGFAGGRVEVYLWEKFNSHYFSNDTLEGSSYSGFESIPVAQVPTLSRSYILSSANISAFFKVQLLTSGQLDLSARISLGTNFYSDWSQYRKYVWLGVGLELGIGKRQLTE